MINTDKKVMELDKINEKYKHSDLTGVVLKAAFEVHNTLGCGFLEKVYENSLCVELKKKGILFNQQKSINVYYNDEIVGEYFADILVENTVIVELKTISKIEKIHEAQLLNYLKATNKKIGLLLNFAKPKLEIKRMVNGL